MQVCASSNLRSIAALLGLHAGEQTNLFDRRAVEVLAAVAEVLTIQPAYVAGEHCCLQQQLLQLHWQHRKRQLKH